MNHYVNQNSIEAPFPEDTEQAIFGMGCFWGPERHFWKIPGVYSTAVGYAGGHTKNPNYEEVCDGNTGHAEVVMIIFRPKEIKYQELLDIFWESHNPTHGMRQRSDVGTQYRSTIYTSSDDQLNLAEKSLNHYQIKLTDAENKKSNVSSEILGKITTEIKMLDKFYYAEIYHQQYLAKNVNGYCAMKGTGISCSI
ncbi:MAG: peptide-methionine (S)-S-oxide reductase [Woeseiaceae bacterium]|jgi:peptide-methionine (S)-S-oxide reductase|tara:strand:+ start:1518 stop:2102 length:585 start_codon:yes stop_codon:yes gene_type:complete